jgi:hypothetical protein
MAVKALEFGEEMRVWKMTIKNAHGVIRIKSHNEFTARLFDRFHMAGRNIAGSSDKGVRGHFIQSLSEMEGGHLSEMARSMRIVSE